MGNSRTIKLREKKGFDGWSIWLEIKENGDITISSSGGGWSTGVDLTKEEAAQLFNELKNHRTMENSNRTWKDIYDQRMNTPCVHCGKMPLRCTCIEGAYQHKGLIQKQTGKWKLRWNTHTGGVGHVHNNEQDETIYALLDEMQRELEWLTEHAEKFELGRTAVTDRITTLIELINKFI